MSEYLKPLYPEGPCNRTDPIVRHDSPYRGGVIVKLYEPQNDPETNKNNPNAKAVMNQIQQSGMSPKQFVEQYAKQNNMDISQMVNMMKSKGIKL